MRKGSEEQTSILHNATVPDEYHRTCLLFICFPGVTTHCGCVFHSPVAGFSLLAFEVSWSYTTKCHSRLDSSGRVINPSQRPIPDNKQHSQQTNIHAPGGIRTHNRSMRAAEDLRLRPRGHWDRHHKTCTNKKQSSTGYDVSVEGLDTATRLRVL